MMVVFVSSLRVLGLVFGCGQTATHWLECEEVEFRVWG